MKSERHVIALAPLGETEEAVMALLQSKLPEIFHTFRFEILPRMTGFEGCYDKARGQYNSTKILAVLNERICEVSKAKLLGISSFDIYIPSLNFVFGEAECPGTAALISTFRLRIMKAGYDDHLFKSRVLKEAVHEIGHMLGLTHCPDPFCVMHFSNSIVDTDRKGVGFCNKCGGRLGIEVHGKKV